MRLLLTIILLNLGISACSVNPVTGKTELSLIPASQEVAMGESNYLPYQQMQGGSYIVDPDLNRYVAEVGQKLARVSDRPNLPYEFVVLNNSVPNAWALPGGKIAINRGLLLELEDEAQLAAVLGHEIVHAAGKHSVKQMQQSMLLGAGVMLAGASTDNDLVSAAAGMGAGLIGAKYGRDQELESDNFGMEYMVKAGYQASAAVELQETFVRLSQQAGASSDWLSGLFASHPPSQERVQKNQAKVAALGNQGTRNRAQYDRAIRQIKQDKEAYDLHDKAMKAASEKKYDQALKLVDQAISKQNEEALFHTAKGQFLLSQKLDSRAAQSFSKALQINPDYFVGHLGLGLIQKKQKRLDQAKQSLLRSQSLLPTQTAVYHLGEIELTQGNRDKAIEYFQIAAQSGGELGDKAKGQLESLQPASESN